MPTLRVMLLTSLIVAAALSRLVPHPWNAAPITAMTLFAAAYLPSRRWSVALPLTVMLLSDIVLYATKDAAYREYALISAVWVYLAILVIAAIGQYLRGRVKFASVLGTTLAGSLVFYLLTNFGAWLALMQMYPRTLSGLLNCYVAGLPFFRGTLLGDLIFTGLLFAGFSVLERAVPQLRIQTLDSRLS